LDGVDRGFKAALPAFLDDLRSHLWLDGGRLAVAHAGLKAEMIGRGSAAVREFALYGETTGEIDEFGLPVRADWAASYRGETAVIYGHTPMPEAQWVNNTLCIDTGCVFGGKLTALRWPEKTLVEVAARQVWCEPVRPLAPADGGRSTRPWPTICSTWRTSAAVAGSTPNSVVALWWPRRMPRRQSRS